MPQTDMLVLEQRGKIKIALITEEPKLMDYLFNDASNEFIFARRPDTEYDTKSDGYYYGISFSRIPAGVDGHIWAYAKRPNQKPTFVEAYFEYEGQIPERVKLVLTQAQSVTGNPSMRSKISEILS